MGEGAGPPLEAPARKTQATTCALFRSEFRKPVDIFHAGHLRLPTPAFARRLWAHRSCGSRHLATRELKAYVQLPARRPPPLLHSETFRLKAALRLPRYFLNLAAGCATSVRSSSSHDPPSPSSVEDSPSSSSDAASEDDWSDEEAGQNLHELKELLRHDAAHLCTPQSAASDGAMETIECEPCSTFAVA